MTVAKVSAGIARYRHRIVSLNGERLGLVRSVSVRQDSDSGHPTYAVHFIGDGTDALSEVVDLESLAISEPVTEGLVSAIDATYRREIARATEEYGEEDSLTLLLVGWYNWFREDVPEIGRVNGLAGDRGGPE